MLFMATHIELSGAALIPEAERQTAFQQVLSNASQRGVVIHGLYVNELDYTAYFLFEADNARQIAAVFDPILAFGHLESVPVVDRLEL